MNNDRNKNGGFQMVYSDKVRENRVRRHAKKEGYYIKKYRTTEGRSINYGMYTLIRIQPNIVEAERISLEGLENFFEIDPKK